MAAWQLVGSRLQPCFAGQAVQAMGAVHLQRANRSRRPCTVVAYSVRDNIHDWRVKQMIDIANSYFQNLWSQGDLSKADSLLADDFVHNDVVWGKQQLVAGPKAFKHFVANVREAYPDFSVWITEVGVCGTTRLFVQWEGEATNLGEYHAHKPTRHNSCISGINLMSFTEDRSQLTETIVYRVPLAEDRSEVEAADTLHELHLRPLQ